MAIAFRAAGAANQGTTGAVSLALPAGIQINDILILVASTIAGGSISITTTGGFTWNAVTGSPIDVTSGEKLYVWWARLVTGSETAPSITPGSDHSIGRIAAYSGVQRGANPINVQAASSEATSDTSFSFATGISTTVANCLVLCACTTGADTTSAQFSTMGNTSLTSLAERMDNETTNGGGGGFALAEGVRATAGTCGTFTSTLSTASPKAYIAFAFIPLVDHALTANGLTTTPSLDSPAISQNHSLAAPAELAATATLASPTMAQNHSLGTPAALVVGSPEPGTPILTVYINYSLVADPISCSPQLGMPAIAQQHSLTAAGLSTTPQLGQAVISQDHGLAVQGISAQASLGQPAISQNHVLSAEGESAQPQLDQPILLQNHSLTASGISAQLELGDPELAEHVEGELYADPISVSVVLGSPALHQVHALAAVGFNVQMLLGEPELQEYEPSKDGAGMQHHMRQMEEW